METKHANLKEFYNIDGRTYKYTRWQRNPIMVFDFNCTCKAITKALAQVNNKDTALEIGCGPGTWTPLLAQKFDSTIVVDLSYTMIEEAKKDRDLSDVEFHISDFMDIEFNKKFDFIMSIRSFEYFSDKDAFMRKCHSLLKPEGNILILTKTLCSYWYGRSRIRDLFEALCPSLFKYELCCQQNVSKDHLDKFWLQKVSVRQMKQYLIANGFEVLSISPVIIRPPIYMRGKGEIPLIPPALERASIPVLSFFDRILSHFSFSSIFAESFLITGRKQ